MNVEYVYYDTWFMWNAGAILLTLAMSTIMYLVLITDGELKVKVARPRWIASIPSVTSVLWLGLYCIIPILTYIMVSYWMDRLKAKRLHQ
jgi:hypothetical protein